MAETCKDTTTNIADTVAETCKDNSTLFLKQIPSSTAFQNDIQMKTKKHRRNIIKTQADADKTKTKQPKKLNPLVKNSTR